MGVEDVMAKDGFLHAGALYAREGKLELPQARNVAEPDRYARERLRFIEVAQEPFRARVVYEQETIRGRKYSLFISYDN